MGMKVGKSCAGCDYCDYNICDDYGCYDPGYYCYSDHCIEEDYQDDGDGN